ncbi:hypothetical protein FXE18_15225 [Vibrio cholerae]|nr:hypothetical protein [Vibrio cholerae]TXX75866.1 hypothetical protein FXE96_14605 [Vibrio cholerae]TYA63770.1 hypothetical protein FXE18_15225 [Vibrio cholerae]
MFLGTVSLTSTELNITFNAFSARFTNPSPYNLYRIYADKAGIKKASDDAGLFFIKSKSQGQDDPSNRCAH